MNDALLAHYLDERDGLSADEYDALLAHLRKDEHVHELREILEFNDLLSRTLSPERQDFPARLKERLREVAEPTPAPSWSRRVAWGLALAATLALAGGLWVYRPTRPDTPERGTTIVTGTEGRLVVLGDYATVDLAPQSAMRIEGAQRNEALFLQHGSVFCNVDRGKGAFTVRTVVGTVAVIGTEFTVSVHNQKTQGAQTSAPGEDKAMTVAVDAGSVLVNAGDATETLTAGHKKTFVAARNTPNTAPVAQEAALLTRLGPLVAPLNTRLACGPERFVTVGAQGMQLEDASGTLIASDWTVGYHRGPRCPVYYRGHLYLPRTDPKGIRVYDLRDGRFAFVGRLPSRPFSRMAIRDGWLICIDNFKLETYDLRQGPLPQEAVLLARIKQPASFDFEDERFVLAVKDEFMVYDISDWPQLKLLTTVREHKKVERPQGPVVLAGDSLWWGGVKQHTLRYDLSDLADISSEDAGLSFPARAYHRAGDRLAVFAHRASVTFEIDREANTLHEGKQLIFNPANHGATFPVRRTVMLNDEVLIYAGDNGVSTYALDHESGPRLLGTGIGPTLPSSHGVAIRDGILYCNGNIYDFRDPGKPQLHADAFPASQAVAVVRNRLVIADEGGLLAYSLEDPLNPQEVQRESLEERVEVMTSHQNFLWVAGVATLAAGESGIIRRYRLREDLRLKREASLLAAPGAKGFSSLGVDGEHLVAALKGKEVVGYRLRADGLIEPQRFSFTAPHGTRQLQLRDGLVIMANTEGALRIVDLFRDAPTQLASLETVESSLSIALHGDTGYVAEGFSGVSMVGFDWSAIHRVAQLRREAAEKERPLTTWIKQLKTRRVTRDEDGQVEALDLSGLEITEEMMTSLALAPELQKLKMQDCRLSPSVFAGFAGLVNLHELSLHQASISGADLAVLAGLPNLNKLTLRSSDVSDSQMQGLAGARIQRLSLGNTELTDAGLAVLAQLPALDHLGLHSSRISSAGLDALLPLADRLVLLRLSHTAIDDAGAATIGRLKSLTFLELMDTRIGDPGLAHLARLPALGTLILRGSPVTSAGVKVMPPMPSLRRLMVGELDPAAVEHLLTQPSLQVLYAPGTRIDNALAEKISASRLKDLTVGHDDITHEEIRRLESNGIKVSLTESAQADQLPEKAPGPPAGKALFTGGDGDLQWRVFADGVVSIGYRGDYETTNLQKTFQQEGLEIATVVAVGSSLWVGSNRGIFEYNPQTWSWSRMAINATDIVADVHQMTVADGILSVSYGADVTASFDISQRRWLASVSAAAQESTPTTTKPVPNAGPTKAPLRWLLIAGLIVATLAIGLRMRARNSA